MELITCTTCGHAMKPDDSTWTKKSDSGLETLAFRCPRCDSADGFMFATDGQVTHIHSPGTWPPQSAGEEAATVEEPPTKKAPTVATHHVHVKHDMVNMLVPVILDAELDEKERHQQAAAQSRHLVETYALDHLNLNVKQAKTILNDGRFVLVEPVSPDGVINLNKLS